MIPDTIRLPNLLVLLEKFFGSDWYTLDPATIASFLQFPDYLVVEKVNVLTYIKQEGLNKALENASFVLLMTSAANNEYSDFETITVPTSLELGWCVSEAKAIAKILNQDFIPSESLSQVASYVLKEDGYSSPVAPLDFANLGLEAGQHESDVALKEKGMAAYIDYMTKQTGV